MPHFLIPSIAFYSENFYQLFREGRSWLDGAQEIANKPCALPSFLPMKRSLLRSLLLTLVFLSPALYAATSVSQYGITWTFDKDYPTGQFCTGDYWVVGPVTAIEFLSPNFGVDPFFASCKLLISNSLKMERVKGIEPSF